MTFQLATIQNYMFSNKKSALQLVLKANLVELTKPNHLNKFLMLILPMFEFIKINVQKISELKISKNQRNLLYFNSSTAYINKLIINKKTKYILSIVCLI